MAPIVLRVARVWGGSVYAAMVPVTMDIPTGAAGFIEDLWRAAPWRIALPSTLGVLAIALSPPLLLGRFRLFHQLDAPDQQRLLQRWLRVRLYPLRILFFAVKGQALVAVLRDEHCRAALGLETV
jgi:hypothetical protein